MRRVRDRATAAPQTGLYIRFLIATVAALMATAVATAVATAILALAGSPQAAQAQNGARDEPQVAAKPGADAPDCAPGVDFLGFSDALNKTTFESTNVGGLSALTYDRRNDVYYSLVDNERETPARFYTLDIPLNRSGLGEPRVQDVTFLRDDSGQTFTGANFDGEGLALTRKGDLFA